MLVNLTTHTSFPCVNHEEAIYCTKDRGPDFGRGELQVWNEPFNEDRACYSRGNDDVYRIPIDSEGVNMLTNQKCNHVIFKTDCNFTISEFEVWGVTFKE